MFRERSTPDQVIFIFAVCVCFIIVFGLISTVVLAIARPDINQWKIVADYFDVTNTLIAAVVAYVAGRAEGFRQAKHDQGSQP